MKRPRQILLQILIALILLELILQAGAAVVYLTVRDPGAIGDAGDGPTILCLGDSYTYGLGSSAPENSYPAVLQKALRQRLEDPPAVVNAGWPGQDSRDVLLRLDQQLVREQPQLVFILIGVNDMWSRPKRVELGAADGIESDASERGWRWRWRTARLVRLAFSGRAKDAGEPDAVPAPDEHSPPLPIAGEETEDTSRFTRGVRRLEQRDAHGAIVLFREAMEEEPEKTPECYQGLVQAYTVLGQPGPARDALAWLETEWRQRPTATVAEAYAVSLAVVRDAQLAAQVACDALQQFPESSSLWWLLGEDHAREGDLSAAEAAHDRAIETATPDDPVWQATVRRACAMACAARDPAKAIDLIVSSLLLDRDYHRCRGIVMDAQVHFTAALVRERLAALQLAGPDLELAQRLFTEALQRDRTAECAVLADHLRKMVERCRAHGAQPVLLTYPFPILDVEAVQQEIARTTGTELVPIRQRFENELRSRSRNELFIPDGHCSDAGYEIMGDAAAEAALTLLGDAD